MATELSLKLVIDPKCRRVLFAEASKDVVDFLFSLLSIPMASIVKLLTTEQMAGSFGNIYRSVENLDEMYITSNQTRNLILNPTYSSCPKNALFLTEPSRTTETIGKFYRCNISSSSPFSPSGNTSSSPFSPYGNLSSSPFSPQGSLFSPPLSSVLPSSNSCKDYYTNICTSFSSQMASELRYAIPKPVKVVDEAAGRDVGFVKGVVAYTVMDDLTVTPMSAISNITLLDKFNVKDVSLLEERRVKLGINEDQGCFDQIQGDPLIIMKDAEGLKLLKASLQSKTVLNDVFLGMKAEPM